MKKRVAVLVGAMPSSLIAIGMANAFVIGCAILSCAADRPSTRFAHWRLRGALEPGIAEQRRAGPSALPPVRNRFNAATGDACAIGLVPA